MKKLIQSQRGVGLLEVVIATAIGGIVLAGFANQYLMGQQMTSYISKNENLDQILRFALIEIENRSPTQRPPVGTCRVRVYNQDGERLSQTNMAGTDCKDVDASGSNFILAWQVKPQSEVGGHFSESAMMKLPSVTSAVNPIEIYGKFIDHRSSNTKTKKYVIYGKTK